MIWRILFFSFSATEGVMLIAATNTPDVLDKALTRPGRFDKHVSVPLPDVRGRMKILQVHSKEVIMSPAIDMEKIARQTTGYSGADLANLINQAAIKASKEGARAVRTSDLEWARDKIDVGPEIRSRVMPEKAQRLTAYHEGGHTLVTLYTQGATPLHKVTIISRGQALGITWSLPEMDKYDLTRREILARIDVCMGGRAAEELVNGADDVTTGAYSDLQSATGLARRYVMSYGMSDKVGLMQIDSDNISTLGSEMRAAIDQEVKAILDVCFSHRLNRMLMI